VKLLPNPNGCRLCGIDQRGHAIQTGPDGTHTWQAPTQQQIKDRMRARQAAHCSNCGPTTTEPHPRLPTQRCSNCKEHEHNLQVSALEDQLYAEDPSDRADAYLALRAMEGGPDAC
jgi:predicted Zn-ribbon and HTH transcriptional regulator